MILSSRYSTRAGATWTFTTGAPLWGADYRAEGFRYAQPDGSSGQLRDTGNDDPPAPPFSLASGWLSRVRRHPSDTELGFDLFLVPTGATTEAATVAGGWWGSSGGVFIPLSTDLSVIDGQGVVYLRLALESVPKSISTASTSTISPSHASTVPNSSYEAISGASMAAPYAAGVAVALAQNPAPTTAELKSRPSAVDLLPQLAGLVSTRWAVERVPGAGRVRSPARRPRWTPLKPPVDPPPPPVLDPLPPPVEPPPPPTPPAAPPPPPPFFARPPVASAASFPTSRAGRCRQPASRSRAPAVFLAGSAAPTRAVRRSRISQEQAGRLTSPARHARERRRGAAAAAAEQSALEPGKRPIRTEMRRGPEPLIAAGLALAGGIAAAGDAAPPVPAGQEILVRFTPGAAQERALDSVGATLVERMPLGGLVRARLDPGAIARGGRPGARAAERRRRRRPG